jgi:outer membrane receptor protein involved in Fe transport
MVRAVAVGLVCWALGSAFMIAEAVGQSATGTIVGRVVDAASGKPIAEAGVEVVGEQITVRTDTDGSFRVSVRAGTHELRVFAPLYGSRRIRDVRVETSQETRADAELKPEVESRGIEVIEVVAEVRQADEATQMLQRQRAAVVSDTISAQLIRKSPDSDAAEIVQRIPAVTLQDDRFLVVRGLGDRYSSAILNGSRLPSTDPDKRVVSLDLFPADFIDAIDVIKSYTPDLPGDFSGGLVDIRLQDVPERLTWNLGVSSSANTETTFQDFDTYKGSELDPVGFGADYRKLPDTFPSSNITTPTGARQKVFASSLRNIWDVDTTTAPPNFSIDLGAGNRFGPVGASLAASFSNEYKFRGNELRGGFTSPDDLAIGASERKTFFYDRSQFEVKLGAIAIVGWDIAPGHQVVARGFVNRNTTDQVLDGQGVDPDENPDRAVFETELMYREDQLGFGQFGGLHSFGPFEVDWRTALSQTTRDEPDTRQYRRTQDPGQTRSILDGRGNVRRLFSNLDEWLSDSALDVTLPFDTRLPFTDVWSGLEARWKSGVAYLVRQRDFEFRRFQYVIRGNDLDLTLSPEVLLAPELIGISEGVQFLENTETRDSFDAKQDIAAIYTMLDLPIVEDRLRFVGGVRVEYSYIDTNGADGQSQPVSTQINDLDPLPGVNLIYSPIENMNIRVGWAQTVSRPEFRELTPTQFPVPGGTRTVVGYPFLTTASIDNYDLRWEWFFSGTSVLSASFFYKELKNPIEKVGLGQTSSLADTFRNADDATIWGFELEARSDLSFASTTVEKVRFLQALGPELYNISLSANATFAESEANISDTQASTNSKRALQGQPDFVVNAALEYENDWFGTARLLYNTIGEQITAAGSDGLPDILQQRRDQLDFVWTRKIDLFGEEVGVKLTAENILNDQFIEKQGDFATVRYVTGVKFGVGLSYSF